MNAARSGPPTQPFRRRLKRLSRRVRKKPARLLLRLRGYDNSQAILLEPYRAIYFQIPKVASSSIKKRLMKELDVSGFAPHTTRFPAPDPERLEAGDYDDYFRFAFVRNPWARIVSCYQSKIRRNRNVNGPLFNRCLFYLWPKSLTPARNRNAGVPLLNAGLSFAEFVDAVSRTPDSVADKHFRSQHRFLCDDEGRLQVDFLGRLENFDEDFERVAERIGMPGANPKKRDKSYKARGSYRDFYDQTTWDAIADRYREDIELLGYGECRL